MTPAAPSIVTVALLALSLVVPASAGAQAFTAPQGIGAITMSWQLVDNTGHRLSDGTLFARGESITTSALFEIEYGITDRLSATTGLPYVFAKYTGADPPLSGLPYDACRCWQSGLQDLSLSVRYRFGDEFVAITPSFSYGNPTHDYNYQGEAVVGRNLKEAQIGVSAGIRLIELLPKATVQAGYVYAFVERPLEDVDIDRSHGFLGFGYAFTPKFYARGSGIWQYTHGGLRAGSPSGPPFPGELNTPERYAQRDRLIKSHYWQLGGGVSYSLGPVDVFGSYMKYIWGRDAHNGQVFTAGTTWYFDTSRPTP